MGLDSFWVHPDGEDVPHPEFDPPLRLCGGMFSGNGSGSFRGKVYEDLVREVTGHSLYQEVIDNETVRAMADDLAVLQNCSSRDNIEQKDIARMFRAYADAGFELKGWW